MKFHVLRFVGYHPVTATNHTCQVTPESKCCSRWMWWTLVLCITHTHTHTHSLYYAQSVPIQVIHTLVAYVTKPQPSWHYFYPVVGSTKFWEWFTVWCVYPRVDRVLWSWSIKKLKIVYGMCAYACFYPHSRKHFDIVLMTLWHCMIDDLWPQNFLSAFDMSLYV